MVRGALLLSLPSFLPSFVPLSPLSLNDLDVFRTHEVVAANTPLHAARSEQTILQRLRVKPRDPSPLAWEAEPVDPVQDWTRRG